MAWDMDAFPASTQAGAEDLFQHYSLEQCAVSETLSVTRTAGLDKELHIEPGSYLRFLSRLTRPADSTSQVHTLTSWSGRGVYTLLSTFVILESATDASNRSSERRVGEVLQTTAIGNCPIDVMHFIGRRRDSSFRKRLVD